MTAALASAGPPLLGILVGVILGWLVASSHEVPAAREHQTLTDQDRDAIEAQFLTHARASQAEVSRYADVLAGDDQLLRARLQQIQGGRRTA